MSGKWMMVGEVLDKFLAGSGLKEGVRRHTAVLGWEEVVGERIARKARPRDLRGKTLFVDVDGSAWIHELSFLRQDILKKLNERVGGDAVDRIVFMAKGNRDDKGASKTGKEEDHGRGR